MKLAINLPNPKCDKPSKVSDDASQLVVYPTLLVKGTLLSLEKYLSHLRGLPHVQIGARLTDGAIATPMSPRISIGHLGETNHIEDEGDRGNLPYKILKIILTNSLQASLSKRK